MSVFRNLLMQTFGWIGKPADWADIRKDCPENSIALYAAHTEDFSSYDNLGFIVNCIGGYNVFIDGTQYGSTYASGAKCSITWSTSGITTGDDITTPSTLKAHKIWITPATEGRTINNFSCARVATSGNEEQGLLWAHYNLTNRLSAVKFADGNTGQYYNKILTAVTAKNNLLKIQEYFTAFYNCESLEYLPIMEGDNVAHNGYRTFAGTKALKKVTLNNFIFSGVAASGISYNLFDGSRVEKIKGNSVFQATGTMFANCEYLEELPENLDFSNSTNCNNFITNAVALKDTVLDTREGIGITKLGCVGTASKFMSGFKGLRASNEAPFNNATAPQINVSYTGMDRSALVQLFNDLPYNVGYTVVGSPTITDGVASDFSRDNRLVSNLSFIDNGQDFEFVFHIKTPTNAAYTGILSVGNSAYSAILNFRGDKKCGANIVRGYGDATSPMPNILTQELELDTWYYIKWTRLNHVHTIYSSTDGINYTAGDSTTLSESKDLMYSNGGQIQLGWHNAYGATGYAGSINLNNTYIKVNDVYWFRGQPAMTKTLSCVGATGTANLTQEDKDIALSKGWNLTLS